MDRLKLNQLLGSVFVAEFGLLFLGIGYILVKQLPLTLAKDVPTLPGRMGVAAVAALVVVAVFEGFNWRFRQSLAMKVGGIDAPDTTIYQRLATVNQFTDLLKAIFFDFLLLVAVLVMGYFLSRERVVVTTELVTWLAVFPIWLAVRRSVLGGLGKLIAKGSPSYAIAPEGDAVLISGIADLNRRREACRIPFAAIEEIRAFTAVEAEAFRKYELGPDVALGVQATRDLVRFTKGEIPYPGVYGMGATNTTGRSVLLRGPGLFFWTQYGNQDGSDLIDAFERYRGRGVAGRPAASPS